MLTKQIRLRCRGCTHMLDAMRHCVSAGAAKGEVQHHNLISSNESGDRHDEDQVPEEDIGSVLRRSHALRIDKQTKSAGVR